ncbi:MAG: ACP S-malonyltransferase [Bdellovibrionota bacterium]
MTNQKALIVFAGQGSQFPGMAKAYFENFDLYKKTLEEASDASGLHLKKISFDSSEAEMRESSIAQVLILSSSIGMWRVLSKQFGILDRLNPVFAGHSLGEYSALVAAGAFDFSEAVRAVQKRGQFMSEAVAPCVGAMRALILREPAQIEKLQNFCKHVTQLSGKLVAVANWNTETQVVLSGYEEALKQVDLLAGKEDAGGDWKWIRRSIALDVSGPFHSPLMKKAEDLFLPTLEALSFKNQKSSYIRNIDAKLCEMNSEVEVKKALKEQVCGSVQWYPSLLCAKDSAKDSAKDTAGLPVTVHAEISPSKVLTNMASRMEAFKEWNFMNFEDPSKIEEVLK